MSATSRSSRELRRFLLVGSTTVGIDFLSYYALLWGGVQIDVAKALGFISGMVFAWFANRSYTFEARGGAGRLAGFVVLYLATLGLNVAANRFGVWILGVSIPGIVGAFLVATGLSATANFLGMKYLVFKRDDP